AYTVEVKAPGRAPLRESILVERDRTVELDLVPPPAAAVPDGYIYIAPGWFLYGSAADENTRRIFFTTVPQHRRHTDAFLIARTPARFRAARAGWACSGGVAQGEAPPGPERPKLAPTLPLKLAGGVKLERTSAGWRLTLLPVERTYSADWGEPIRYDGRKRHA